MALRMLIVVGSCCLINSLIGMELIELCENKDNRIRSLHAAKVFVSTVPQGQWKSYTLSSTAIAHVIKNERLCQPSMPEDDEVAIIKTLKREQPKEYAQLVNDTFALLHSKPLSLLQDVKSAIFSTISAEVVEKNTVLEGLKNRVASFDRCENFFHTHIDVIGAIFLCIYGIEIIPLIVTLLLSLEDRCWDLLYMEKE